MTTPPEDPSGPGVRPARPAGDPALSPVDPDAVTPVTGTPVTPAASHPGLGAGPAAGSAVGVADRPAAARPAARPSGGKAAGGGPGRPARRRPSRWKVAFFVLTAVGMVAAVVWALLGSRFLVVRSIQVTGNHLVPKSEVLAEAQIPMGLPLVRVNTSAVARRVERITQVQSARVTRDWPDRIVITVLERTPALAIRAGPGFDLVDASGVVVRQVTRKPAGMPLFAPVGTVLGNPGVRATVAVLADLPAGIARSVRSVTAPSAEAVTLHLAAGITVDWGNSSQSVRKAHELAILLHTHARYYDVSAPGSAVTG